MASITLMNSNRMLPVLRSIIKPRMSFLLPILLVGLVSTGSIFAEDLPASACQASNSLSVLVNGKNVVAYVPKGAWLWPVPNISVMNIEGNSITPKQIVTPAPRPNEPEGVNSCASNAATGQTICTGNNANVYVISGTTLKSTLRSSGAGMNMFIEGNCTNCGVTMDPIHNVAVIGLHLGSAPMSPGGFQLLDLGSSPKFETAFASQATDTDQSGKGQISAGFLFDPIRNLILSPNEHGNYEIVRLANNDNKGNGDNDNNGKGDNDNKGNGNDNKGNGDNNKGDNDNKDDGNGINNGGKQPAFFQKSSFPAFASAGEDCATGIALASVWGGDPSMVYIADLNRAKTTSAGTWNAPSQIQTLSESHLSNGANGIAVAQGTHTGIVTGEFGFDSNGGNITAILLPKDKGGDSSPAISDWVTCSIPGGFQTGFDPHTVTAYESPANGHAMALVASWPGDPARRVAVIDLTKMLDDETVPRTKGKGLGHACASPGLLSTAGRDAVVRFVSVP